MVRLFYAMNRDGDLGLVECPSCHNYNLRHLMSFDITDNMVSSKPANWNDEGKFYCMICKIKFKVYVEDGVRTIYPDLSSDGYDGHGHCKYEILKD